MKYLKRYLLKYQQVDFEVIAQKVGIKYAKNARQSFKRVWEKLKNGGSDSGPSTPGKTTPRKTTQGKVATPRKNTKVAPKTPRKKTKKVKKEEDTDEEEEDYDKLDVKKEEREEDSGEDTDNEEEQLSDENGQEEHLVLKDEDPSLIPVKNELSDPESDNGEEFEAATRDMTVEELRAWKAQNNYDSFRAVTPGYDYEV